MFRAALALWICASAAAAAEPSAAGEPARRDGATLLALAPSHAPLIVGALPTPPSWLNALPPPPDKVVRETRTFGTVTVDHKAHLARRSPCASCHEKGPVAKITFTPRSAHERCRGCHLQLARGPTECRGCHIVAPKDPPAVASEGQPGPPAATTAGAATATQQDGAPAPIAQAVGAPPATGPGGAPTPPIARTPADDVGESDVGERVILARTAELGFAAVSGQRQDLVVGPWFQLRAQTGASVVTYSLALSGSGREGRTQFLVGGGRTFRLMPRIRATAVALGGLDATHGPVSVLPAVGLRAGVEVLTPSRWSVGFSVTALADLLQSEAAGERSDGATISFGIVAGHRLSQ